MDRPADALAVWYRVANRPDNRSLYPLLEIAKYCEHVTKDLAAARAACERALALIEQHHARMGYARAAADRDELQRRVARIEQRLNKMAVRTVAAGRQRAKRSSARVEPE
jgi:DNA-binding FrmR family transcriptional regulator